jgi:hypothetical protein
MITKLPPAERKQELVQLLNSNPPLKENGQVDWEKIWVEKPLLQQRLGATDIAGKSRLSVMVAYLRKEGKAPRSNYAPDRKPRPTPKHLSTATPFTGKYDLFEQVLTFQGARGTIDFKAALAAHPEWVQQYGLENKETYNTFRGAVGWYVRGGMRRRLQQSGRIPVATPSGSGAVAVATSQIQNPPPAPAAAPPTQAAPVTSAANGNGSANPQRNEKYDIYETILGFKKQGGNYLKLALIEHPEWIDRFDLNTSSRLATFRSGLDYYAKKIRRKYLAMFRSNGDEFTEPATPEAPALATPIVNICPRCGFGHFDAPTNPHFAEIFKQALDIALKMATKKTR